MRSANESTVVRVRLTPKGGMDAVIKREGEVLHVRVAAPPVDGAANRALINFLSKTLSVAKSRISVVSGETSRDKTLRFDGISFADLDARLNIALGNTIEI